MLVVVSTGYRQKGKNVQHSKASPNLVTFHFRGITFSDWLHSGTSHIPLITKFKSHIEFHYPPPSYQIPVPEEYWSSSKHLNFAVLNFIKKTHPWHSVAWGCSSRQATSLKCFKMKSLVLSPYEWTGWKFQEFCSLWILACLFPVFLIQFY